MSSKRMTKKVLEVVTAAADTKPVVAGERKRGRPKKVVQEKNHTSQDSESEESPYFKNAGTKSKTTPNKKQRTETKLGREFYDQDTVTLAKAMLGKVLCRKLPESGEILKGTIVETEAYTGKGDAASHSFKGIPTPASKPMFMDPGTAYVYMTYGMYHCFNISSNDHGGACLLRAAEPIEEYEVMQHLRRPKKKTESDDKEETTAKRFKLHELANGPAKLCLSFNITKASCNEIDMTTSDDLWLEQSTDEKYSSQEFEIEVSKRVGIDNTPPEARNQLYRFFVKDNVCVSKAKFKSDGKGGKTGGGGKKTRLGKSKE